MESSKEQKYKIAMIIIITIFITFIVTAYGINWFLTQGEQVGKYVMIRESNETNDISSELEKYKKVIQKYYFGEVNEEKLKEGAIKGYIEGLGDPYTEYIPKEEMEDYMESTKGNFVGIGIYMAKNTNENRVQIVSVIKDSPAEKSGILMGDLIKTVNGEEYTAEDFNKISSKIKGEADTTVKLEIIRDNETIPFEIKREKIVINKVEEKVVENNIGYIKIPSFDETTSQEFKNKYEELQKNNINSLIIDLRNNGGGIVSEALNIADYIADKGSTLLYEVDKDGKELEKKSENDPIVNIPVVAIVNGNSASSTEILVGALKDLGKAKIVGTKTYGKGVIQQIISMTDGSGLKITTEEYQTPNRNKIHKIGIEPDEKIELPESLKNKADIDISEDTQLKKAIEILK